VIEQVFGQDSFVGQWVADQLPGFGGPEGFGPFYALGFALDGRLIAGAVYHEFRPHPFGADVRISFAASSPRWGSSRNIRAVFAIPFLQYGCGRVTTVAGRRNAAARRLNEGVGFTFEGLIRRGWDGREDAIVYGMLREECRWLKEKADGQEVQLAAGGARSEDRRQRAG